MKLFAQLVAFVIGTFIAVGLRSGDGSVSIGDLLWGALWGGGITATLVGAFFKDNPISKGEQTLESQSKDNIQSISTSQTSHNVTVSQEDHLPKLKKLKEMYDTGLITAQDYDTQKAEILSRLVSEPTFTTQPAISQQTTAIQPTIAASNKSPIGAAVLSFFLLGGAGQIYLGQWKKGIALMVSSFLLSLVFVGILVQIIGIGDAYGVAQKLSGGKSVGEWEFNINWKVAGLVTLIYAIAICGIVTLTSSSQPR